MSALHCVPLPAALTEPERTAWIWRYDNVLGMHLVVRQVRDRAQILVLGRMLDRYSLVLRPTFAPLPAAVRARWLPALVDCWWGGQPK